MWNVNPSRSLTPQIIPHIHQLLEDTSLSVANLEGLAVSLGPGTFTGLRVGLATMTAFRLALGVPLVGVSTLEGLAWNLPNSDLPHYQYGLDTWRSCVLGKVSLATWERLFALNLISIGKLPEICANLSEPTCIVGDGWIRNT